MAILPVRIYGDPVLRKKAAPVTEFDESVQQLAAEMRETMAAYRGVGLAANQVGVLKRVLVIDVPLDDNQRAQLTLVNPAILKRSGAESGEEGCLSIPGIFEEVSRSLAVQVTAADEFGKRVELEAEGYLARAIQHEIDHLDGVLFVDRLGALKRQFLKGALAALARGELPEDYRPPAASGGAS